MDPFKQAKIRETNARYFGMSETKMIDNAGNALAGKILSLIEHKNNPTVSIICGLGNNGADGIACAYYLITSLAELKAKATINIYLIGREQELKTEEAVYFFKKLKKLIKESKPSATNLKIDLMQDSYAESIIPSDFIVEALLGSGIKGGLHKRYKDVINKIARMKAYKIAIDSPVPGYKANIVLSLITPKQKNAEILDIGLPKEVDTYIGPGLIKFLYKPPKQSHKTMNGELLVFGGSALFHGAPIMSIKAASKFIGSVFFYTNPENRELINKQKIELEEFISLREEDLEKYSDYSNIILAGPGLEENMGNAAVLTYLLNKYPEKTFILDAYAIAMANPRRNPQNRRGFKNCILTPHRGELRHIFDEAKLEGLEGKLKRLCLENKCHLVLKGHVDLLFSANGQTIMNKNGNAGMAKGGTGDILAGIIAALACRNDSWEALQAGVFLSGFAGDLAKEKYGYNFSATDLIPCLQETYKRAEEF